ncbi:MAG: hypothetical protein DBX44_08595 [Oscillospiraceae bacterium]|nr:MAG: hypothetical protein DBX44_08595 [Oscillospiraceae bacterium]
MMLYQKQFFAGLLALLLAAVPVTAAAEDGTDLSVRVDGNGRIETNDNTTLKAQGGSEGDYQWHRNGESIDGATGNSYVPDRSGDYSVSSGDAQSGSVRVWREFDTSGSSSLVIGKRSNTLASRKDSQIEKLEARVQEAAEEAQQPPETVNLGMIYAAVEAAQSAGGVVTLYDAGVLEAGNRDVLIRLTGEDGLPNRLYCDHVEDRSVITRLSVSLSGLPGSVDLGLLPADEELASLFEEAFSNQMLLLDAAQDGAYGQTVEMMVKADNLSGAADLSFYRYDPDSNRCSPAAVSNVFFDSAGYLHFGISGGGLLVISEGDLEARG